MSYSVSPCIWYQFLHCQISHLYSIRYLINLWFTAVSVPYFIFCGKFSRILIKSSLPYFAKWGLYQDEDFIRVDLFTTLYVWNTALECRSKASCIAFESAIWVLVHQSSQLTIFREVLATTLYPKQQKTLCWGASYMLLIGFIQPFSAFSLNTAPYLSWYQSID